ncbi:MAG: hypothetical protein AW07_03382 [Candidatus Accumulibacter sp. SK-11]|nr:MAG: hypothetical protein AW07_03382 [Candidatus Accumulibacter sp. SK-11]
MQVTDACRPGHEDGAQRLAGTQVKAEAGYAGRRIRHHRQRSRGIGARGIITVIKTDLLRALEHEQHSFDRVQRCRTAHARHEALQLARLLGRRTVEDDDSVTATANTLKGRVLVVEEDDAARHRSVRSDDRPSTPVFERTPGLRMWQRRQGMPRPVPPPHVGRIAHRIAQVLTGKGG